MIQWRRKLKSFFNGEEKVQRPVQWRSESSHASLLQLRIDSTIRRRRESSLIYFNGGGSSLIYVNGGESSNLLQWRREKNEKVGNDRGGKGELGFFKKILREILQCRMNSVGYWRKISFLKENSSSSYRVYPAHRKLVGSGERMKATIHIHKESADKKSLNSRKIKKSSYNE